MNADGFTKIPNTVLRTLIDGADCKTAILLALESRRGYSEKGLPLALLEHEIAIGEEPRPRRTFETALRVLLEIQHVVKSGTRYYSASIFALKVAPKTRQETRQEVAKTPPQNIVPDSISKIRKEVEVMEVMEVMEKTSPSTVFSSSLMPTWKLWVLNSKLAGIPLEQNQKDWNRWVELGLEIELQNHALEVLKAGVYEFPVLALLKRMKGVEAVQHAKLEQRVSEEFSAAAVLERQAITVGSRWLQPGTKLPLQVAEISGTTVFFEDGGPIDEIWLSHMAGWEALEPDLKKLPTESEFRGSGVAA